MTTTPFQDLEQRVNRAVSQHLSNAVAVYQGGEPFGVLFDRSPADPYDGAVDAVTTNVAYCVANTPGIQNGSELVIDGVPHTVTGQVQPDAGGWVVLSVYQKVL